MLLAKSFALANNTGPFIGTPSLFCFLNHSSKASSTSLWVDNRTFFFFNRLLSIARFILSRFFHIVDMVDADRSYLMAKTAFVSPDSNLCIIRSFFLYWKRFSLCYYRWFLHFWFHFYIHSGINEMNEFCGNLVKNLTVIIQFTEDWYEIMKANVSYSVQ